MKKVVLVFLLALTSLALSADTYVWVGNADAVDGIAGPGGRFDVFQNWFNQTTGLPATNAPSPTDDVFIDMELFAANPAGIISITSNYTINSLTIIDSNPLSLGGNIRINAGIFLILTGDLNIPSRAVSIQGLSASSQSNIQFSGTANRIIRSTNTVFTNINFIFSMNALAVNGSITFMDNFENTGNGNNSFAVNAGNINTNGFGVKTTAMVFSNTIPNTPTINFDNSTIEATVVRMSNGNCNLTTSGTNIICTNGGALFFGNAAATTLDLNNITLTNGARLYNLSSAGTFHINQVNCLENATLGRQTNGAFQFNINTLVINSGTILLSTPGSPSIRVNQIQFNTDCTSPAIIKPETNNSTFLGRIQLMNPAVSNNVSFQKIAITTSTITANGGADLGGNSGITFLGTPITYYWCGSVNNNWHNPNNWSVDPMGCVSNGCIPTLNDDVVIDDLHHSPGSNINLSTSIGSCKNISFLNTGASPVTFSGSQELIINGNVILSPPGALTYSHSGKISLVGTSGHTITSNGNTFESNSIIVNCINGSYTFLDNFNTLNTTSLELESGTLNTNGNIVNVGHLISINSITRTLNISNSTININGITHPSELNIDYRGGLVVSSTSSTINITHPNGRVLLKNHYAGGGGLNILNYTNTSGFSVLSITHPDVALTSVPIARLTANHSLNIIHGSVAAFNAEFINVNELVLNAGITLKIQAARTLRINNLFQINGSGCNAITNLVGLDGIGNIVMNTPAITSPNPLNFINVNNITAAGTATPINTTNSTLTGATSGWLNSLPSVAKKYYWIGEAGIPMGSNRNWNEVDNWSLTVPTNGDDISAPCLPGPTDTVVFLNDAAFFHNALPANKVVDVTSDVTFGTMIWGTFTVNPQLISSSLSINISASGSIHLSNTMTLSNTHPVIRFIGSGSHVFDPADRIFRNNIIFEGTGIWNIINNFTVSSSTTELQLLNGSLNIINRSISIGRFRSFQDADLLNITGSTITLISNSSFGGPSVWYLETAGNLASNFISTNSTIRVEPNSGVGRFETFGPAVSYHNVIFTSNLQLLHLRASTPNTYYNKVVFNGNSFIDGTDHLFDTLQYMPGTINTIDEFRTQRFRVLLAKNNPCKQLRIQSSSSNQASLCQVAPQNDLWINVNSVLLENINSGCASPNYVATGNSTLINTNGWDVNPITPGNFGLPDNVNISCSDLSYTLNPDFFGDAVTTYLWSTGATTNAISLNNSGTYTVTATYDAGCSAIDNVVVNINNNLLANALPTPVTCFSATDGDAIINLQNNSPNDSYTYTWSPNVSSTNTASNLAAGTYTVTVSNASGSCTASTSLVIVQPPILTVNMSSTPTSCNGGANGTATAAPAGGNPGYTYLWNNGQTTATATGLTFGNYTVTVTDSKGCTVVGIINVAQPTIVQASIPTSTNVSCFGGSNGTANASGTGGTPGYTYLWSNGSTTASVSGLSAGAYTVTVSDNNGCSATTSVTITEPATPVSANIPASLNVSCFGGNNGEATAEGLNGTPGYTYLWSNGNTTATISNLVAGTYTVTVSDNNGCTASTSVNISQPLAPLSASVSNVIHVSCFGGNNGEATASGNNGTPGYTYLWSNGNNADLATGLSAGSYTVTVTDNNGCTASTSVVINQPAVFTASINTFANATCFGGNNGSATASQTGGVPGYSYQWSNGDLTATASNLTAGTYTVTVTDNNLCTATATHTVNEPSVLDVQGATTHLTCNQSGDGEIQLTVGGGTPGYTYDWSPPVSSGNIGSNLVAGLYTVTVTDNNGCTDSFTATITEPLPFNISTQFATDTVLSCYGDTDAYIEVLVTGSNGPNYTYDWSGSPNGDGTATVNGLGVGTITLTVTDSLGCQSTRTYTVTEPTQLNVSATVNQADCSINVSSGSITVNVTGGTPGYQYNWSHDPLNISNIATDLMAGVYNIHITDNNLCSDSITVALSSINGPSLATNSQDVLCYGENSGIAWGVTNASGTISYQWYDDQLNSLGAGFTNDTAFGLGTGTYILMINANGCVTYDTVQVSEPAPVLLTLEDIQMVTCFQGSNGYLNVEAVGGVGNFSYQWNNGITSDINNNVTAGTYTVTVSDANGCTLTSSYDITQPTAISPSAITIQPKCFGGNDGSIIITSPADTSQYSISWNSAQVNGFTDTSVPFGQYTGYITDSLGCSDSISVSVTQPDSLSITVSQLVLPKCGESTGSIELNVSGGVAPMSYNWSLPAISTTEQADNLSGNIGYSIFVSDANNCVSEISVYLGCTIDSLYIPQFISPNSDGKNDVWEILGIAAFPNIKVTIFNRWGNRVFEEQPYSNSWNGKSSTPGTIGKDLLPTGTYFYLVDLYGDGSEMINGFVEIKP